MKKRIVFMIITALLLFLVLPMASVAAEDEASKLIAYYDFDGNFTDELSGSTLTAFDAAGDGQNHNNATSSFGTDTGEGDTTYWQWTSDQARGGGFWIDVDDLNIQENYSIGVRFVYDDISVGSSWDKIIDYKNRATDDGFYFYSGKLQFYPNSAGTGTTVFSAGTILDIIVTRDATTGQFIAYTVENGTRVKQIDYEDLATRYAIPAEVNGKVRFGFFHDDNATSAEATSGGKVYSIKIWNGPITAEQATGAMETPNRLSFDSNGATGGTAPSDILANEGDDVTIPGNTGSLVKTGMHVAMWNTQDNGGGDDIAFGSTYSMPAEDEELFAKWAANTYSVHFNANGGIGSMSDQSFTYGVAQDLTANGFTLNGYTFGGWATTKDGVVQYTNEQNVSNLSEDNGAVVQLYAKWALKSYDITYNLDGGTNSGSNPATYTTDSATITFADPAKPGYTFGGWFTDTGCTEGNEITGIASGSTGDVEVWAKWTAIVYDITYNLDGGTNDSGNPDTYTIATPTITLADASKTGYTFDGWFTDAGCTAGNEITGIALGSTGDVEVWAKWTPIVYTIKYNLDGGTNNANNPDVYNIESTVIILGEPSKDGYLFEGWYTTAALTEGSEITEIASGSMGDAEVWVKWAKVDEGDAQYREVSGNISVEGGEGQAGIPVTLNSNPRTVFTDANGGFCFDNVNFSDHTLVIRNSAGDVIGEYDLDFTQGSETRVVIDGTTADITYESNAIMIWLDITMNELGTGTTLNDVTVINNPDTGSDANASNVMLWVGIVMVLLVILAGVMVLVAIRKNRYREE